jgi:hypothetical protein
VAYVVLVAALEGGCHRDGCSAGWVADVFANFVYVGQFPDNRREPIPTHGQVAQPFPRQFQKKTAYIFHSKGPVTAEAVAINDLPQRLRIAGVQIFSAPKSANDFGIPNSGGPIWNIRFAFNGCTGEIYNTVDQTLYRDRKTWPDGSREDYVLVFSK